MKSTLLALLAATTLAVPAHAETWAQQATRARAQGYQQTQYSTKCRSAAAEFVAAVKLYWASVSTNYTTREEDEAVLDVAADSWNEVDFYCGTGTAQRIIDNMNK